MILVAHKENSGPKVRLQAVLRLDDGEIIASGNDTTIEDDEVIFSGGKNDLLILASAENERSGQNEATEQVGNCANVGWKVHRFMAFITLSPFSWEAITFADGPAIGSRCGLAWTVIGFLRPALNGPGPPEKG